MGCERIRLIIAFALPHGGVSCVELHLFSTKECRSAIPNRKNASRQTLEHSRQRVIVRNAHAAGHSAYLDASAAPFFTPMAERGINDAVMLEERVL